MPLTKEQIEKIPKLRTKGLEPSQIAIEFGCSVSTILRWIRILTAKGISIPPSRKGRKPILN